MNNQTISEHYLEIAGDQEKDNTDAIYPRLTTTEVQITIVEIPYS